MENKTDKNVLSQIREKFSLPYLIITILVLIIFIGAIYFLAQEKKDTVSIELFTPLGEVPQTTNITVTFSKSVVGDSMVNKWLDKAAIGLKPEIPGKFQWISRDKIRFYPDVMLAPSTEYTAEVAVSIAGKYDYALKGDRRFQFYTQRFRVNSASLSIEYLADEENTVRLLATIEFNYVVTPDEAIKNISIQYADGGKIPFKLLTTAPNSIIALESEKFQRGDEDKEIVLKVSAGMMPQNGNMGLERDFIKPMVMPKEQDLKVERLIPVRDGPKTRHIRIQFNMPLKVEKADQFISIDPQLGFKLTSSHHYLDLRGDFDVEKSYTVSIREGLQAIDGSTLKKNFTSTITFRKENIPPQVDFIGEGYFLTRSGQLNLGISTINVDQVTIEIDKVYSNNLIYLLNQHNISGSHGYYWYDIQSLGKEIHRSEMVLQKLTNEEVITPFNIREYLKDERSGIFNITVRSSRERWIRASKWVMATDLGIIAKRAGNDMWVWVNSLTSLDPLANVEIKLFSKNNQQLMTSTTDENGIAIFESVTDFEEEFAPYLITAASGEDMSFLELTRREISVSDFEVEGDPYLEHGYDAYLYPERGIYRPGETAHLAGVVRGENISVPKSFPVILQLKDPENKIIEEQRGRLNEQGAVEFSWAIPDYAKTGTYAAILLIGESEEIGRTELNVEEFIPDRMKVKLATNNDAYKAGEQISIEVKAVTLFGPPAASRQVEADVEIEGFPFSPSKWSSFDFVDDKKSFTTQRHDLGEQVLDEQGFYQYTFDLPENIEAPSSLRGIISATVLEPGGRGVSAYRSVIIHPYDSYVGLRKAKEGYAQPNRDYEIEFICLSPTEEFLSGHQIEISLYRIYWHSILKKVTRNGRYEYVSEKVADLIQRKIIESKSEVSSFVVRPEEYGKYVVVAKDIGTKASSSFSFYASGWGYAPWAMDNPDRIEMDLDKQTYLPGETAEVQIKAPFTGKLLLTVELEKIFNQKVIDLNENTATVEIPVSENYKPNVYLSAHLIRSTDGLERDTPVRAFGVIPLMMNNESNQLGVEIFTPEEVRSNRELNINYRVNNFFRGIPHLTIAVVDEGICQLTDFQTPDPHGHFLGKKRLGVETADTYSMILPEIEPSPSSAAGGIVEARRKKHLTPVSVTRVKPVAFWSGLLKSDRNGEGKITFKIPQFNGQVRVMAVAFCNDRFGNAEKNVFVREPIVLTPTFPRFISSTDQFIVPVNIYNGTGSAHNFNIEIQAAGPVNVFKESQRKIRIEKGDEETVQFHFRAENTIGKAEFKLTAAGGNETSEMKVDVPVRPPVPFTTVSGQGSITEDDEAQFQFPDKWIAGTTDFSLTISGFPLVQFTRSLQYLLAYPHGCVEQTTSKLFPLLYFEDLAKTVEPELFQANSAAYFLEEGINKLENMQRESGAFSFWPDGDYLNNWSSIYASHFLVEARRNGYVVSDRVYKRMFRALEQFSRDYQVDDNYSIQTAVYACYVLSLAGKPERNTMLYFKNNLLDLLPEYSQYQLAGAFALAGDLSTARSLLPETVTPIENKEDRETGRNFNSPIRAKAIMLDVLAEVDHTNPSVPNLVEMLADAASERSRWGTTQENAFAFLALGKIMKKQSMGKFTGTLTIENDVYEKFETGDYHFTNKDWAGKKVALNIEGEGTCYYSWRAEGIPAGLHVDEYDHDLQVRRHYLNEEGIPINYNEFKQGDLVIAKITVQALYGSLDNVAIVDMLPAGLEIENPRLQSRKGVDWISDKNYQPTYLDIRDDRLILFGDFERGKEETFYYGLRAVTQGTFVLPPIRAESMYNPVKASVASSGKIEVHAFQ